MNSFSQVEQPHTLQASPENKPGHWIWTVATVLCVGLGYFLTDHAFNTSLRTAYTQSADEMLVTVEGGNNLRRLTFLSFAILGLAALALPASQSGSRIRPSGVLLGLFVGWCCLSVFWADAPGLVVRRAFVLVCFSLAAIGLAKQLTGRQMLHIVMWLPLCYLAVGFLGELALGTFRPWASDYRFSGTLHPNTQGLHLAGLCFASAMLARESRRPYMLWAVFAIGMIFLILTKSRTSTAGLFVCLGLLWLLTTAFWVKGLATLVGGWALSALLLAMLFLGSDPMKKFESAALMGRQEQAESLTGRLPIWTTVSEFIARRPLWGYGYDSFWTPTHIDVVSAELGWGIREAHNAYLDTILGTGAIGLLLLLGGILSGWIHAASVFVRTSHPLAGYVFSMGAFSLMNGCTESGMVMPIFAPFFMAVGLLKLSFFPDIDLIASPTEELEWRASPSTGVTSANVIATPLA